MPCWRAGRSRLAERPGDGPGRKRGDVGIRTVLRWLGLPAVVDRKPRPPGALSVYYAHSLRIYRTKREEAEVRQIQAYFPDHEVVNPRTGLFIHRPAGLTAMQQCINLVGLCKVLVFSEYQGHIGAGVWAEIKHAQGRGMLVYLLRDADLYSNFKLELIDLDWAVRYGKVVFR